MIKTVSPQYIGSQKSFYEVAEAIRTQGFFGGYYAFELCADIARGVEETTALFQKTQLYPTGFRVSIDISDPEIQFENELLELESAFQTAARCGYRKALTWIMPGCNTLPPLSYRSMLIGRLRRVCTALARHGIELGIEMVAPKTLQASYRYPAPCKMADLFGLIQTADCPNLGIILDCFHFYCAQHQIEDYAVVTRADQVVMAHISDGVAGRSALRQLDLERRLPGETGVIDCCAMLRHLKELGYRGAVIPEPLDSRMEALSFDTALEQTATAMARIWVE